MVVSRQARFTVGEIEPQLIARNDTEFYGAGADKMRNVVVLPEGGFKRRPGTEYIDRLHREVQRFTDPTITAVNGGVALQANDADLTTVLLTTANIGTTDPYIVVQYDIGAATDVAFVDVVGAKLTTGSNATEFFIQGSPDGVTWASIGNPIPLTTTEVTERRRVRIDIYRYFRFARIGATDLGTAKVSIQEFSVWEEFEEVSAARLISYRFNINQSYIFAFTDRNIAVYRNGEFQADVRAGLYVSTDMSTLNWTSSGDKTVFFHEDVPIHSQTRNGADDVWVFEPLVFDSTPLYDFVPVTDFPAVTLTPGAVSGRITLTAGGAVFAAGDVGQIVEGNGGRARIVSYTSTTVVEALTQIPFYNISAIAANNWTLDSGWEEAWSDTRGYPRSGAFFQQRLWIGGSKSRPRTLWGSELGGFFNFSEGTARDTDAIDVNMDNEEPIVNLVAHRALQIFTTGGESSIILPRTTAITPFNVGVIPQTEQGSEPGIRPVVSNGVVLFVQRGGKSISQLVYDENEQSYTTSNISIYSSHLVRTPIDFALRRSTNTEDSNLLLIVNSDGTLACASFMREEKVQAFTLWTTEGLFKAVNVDVDDIYLVVNRVLNGVDNNFLERASFDYLTDCATKFTSGLPTDTLNGIDYLDGATVSIIADGTVLDEDIVANGEIITAREVETVAEVGINFTPLVKTLPYENVQLIGDKIGTKKRLHKCVLRLYNTSEVFVNGVPVSFRKFNGELLDQAIPVFTGEKRVEGLRGWDDYGQIEITQENPLPLTVLAIGIEASV